MKTAREFYNEKVNPDSMGDQTTNEFIIELLESYSLQFKQQWRDVKEEIPKEFQPCIFIVQSKDDFYNGKVLGGTYQGNKFGRYHGFSTPGIEWCAELWMPLPEKPKMK